ncbi:MAG TPA: DNA-3-methyladenine glycosylase 2 family protein [Candidatus Saccharibacteria bacterium]|nr:DNA-3-methyladenine glycosylase 2 family protein [Candidatus Saccharibacteria bacterium]
MLINNVLANKQTLSAGSKHLQVSDPILEVIIKRAGLPTITPHKNYYQELVESIISQQLSVKAADTILKRFLGLFPGDQFPAPELILSKKIEELRAVGLSWQKAGYIQDLALKIIEGNVKFDHLDALTNDEIIAELTQVKGVGVWTVHMFLIFCMGRLDILPVGDLGIKNGIQKLYELDASPTPEVIQNIATANNWHPYESIASWYVWHSLDNKPAL